MVIDAKEWPRAAEIMIVDDQSANLHLLAEIARGFCPGARIVTFDNPLAAVSHAGTNALDLILTDYRMPQMDGVMLIRTLRALPNQEEVPIICVTASDDRHIRYEALDAGANDYLSRPLDYRECAARCRNLLNMRRLQLVTMDHAKALEERVEQVVQDLQRKKMDTLFRLAKVAEQRDPDTGAHLGRIGRYSRLLARRIGCDDAWIDMLELAAPLHDIGKVAIPDNILLAERRLTEDEWSVMKTHTLIGYTMLAGTESEDLLLAAEIARSHHEKFDGSGYPDALAGTAIPLSARILAVVDVYDALTSKRPYKEAWPLEQARDYLRRESGKHLDPELVSAFLTDFDAIAEIAASFTNGH
jgi:response regulator RpfG family c-di-GMP phosphodiesterase